MQLRNVREREHRAAGSPWVSIPLEGIVRAALQYSESMNIPKLVIFDWDGTLVDSIDPILTGFRQAYQQQSHPCPPDDALRATIGLPLAAAFESLSPGLPAATMVTLYREYWFDPGRPASPWAAGALDTLAWLAAEGIKCAIATGKSRRGAEHELDLLDARDHFLTIYSQIWCMAGTKR